MTNAVKQRPHITDADYYRLGYQLAAQLLNRAAAPAASAPVTASGAPGIVDDDPLAVARQLLDDARTVLAWYATRRATWMRWRRPAPHEDRLRTFLEATIEPCCTLLAARRLYQLDRAEEAAPLVAGVLRRAREGALSYRAYYALACLQANTGDHDDAIASLRRALYEAPRARREELAEWALSDPAFEVVRAAIDALVAALGVTPAAAPDAPVDDAPAEAEILALEFAVDELRDQPLAAVAARVRLATAYQRAERTEEAVALDDRVVGTLTELLGPDHPATLTAREVAHRSHQLLRSSPDRPALAAATLQLRERLVALLG